MEIGAAQSQSRGELMPTHSHGVRETEGICPVLDPNLDDEEQVERGNGDLAKNRGECKRGGGRKGAMDELARFWRSLSKIRIWRRSP
jgi:hypothetical protein